MLARISSSVPTATTSSFPTDQTQARLSKPRTPQTRPGRSRRSHTTAGRPPTTRPRLHQSQAISAAPKAVRPFWPNRGQPIDDQRPRSHLASTSRPTIPTRIPSLHPPTRRKARRRPHFPRLPNVILSFLAVSRARLARSGAHPCGPALPPRRKLACRRVAGW
jgi:hypothetical protein